jgi:hypothetical protein
VILEAFKEVQNHYCSVKLSALTVFLRFPDGFKVAVGTKECGKDKKLSKVQLRR